MDTPSRAIGPQELLEHMHWVQALARGLVRDRSGADDVAQETWRRALEHPAPDTASASSLRGWLARVTRNLARESRRSSQRRTARERRVAHERIAESALDVVARGEMHRELVAAVMRLAEPQRSTVLLRYLDELSMRDIAARTNASEAAVRQRISRGLKELRADLERRPDVDRWLLALALPVSQVARTTHGFSSSLGVWIVNTKLKLALAASTLVAIVAVWVSISTQDATRTDSTNGARIVELEERALSSPAQTIEARESAVIAPQHTEVESTAAAHGAAGRTIEGIVVDAQARPIAGLEIVHVRRYVVLPNAPGEAPRARTDASGRFRIEIGDGVGSLRAASDAWSTIFEPRTQGRDPIGGYVLVLAPRHAVAGRVTNASGKPLSGAQLELELPGTQWTDDHGPAHMSIELTNSLRTTFPLPLDSSWTVRWRTSTDADGQFQIPNAPEVDGARLVTSMRGYASDARDVPQRDAAVIVLNSESKEPGQLRGRVVDDADNPISQATIVLGDSTASTDYLGVFEIDARRAPNASALVVWKRGFAPLVQPCAASSTTDQDAWPNPLVLVLKEKTSSGAIRGRVVDSTGESVPSAVVVVSDVTKLSELLARAGVASHATPVTYEIVVGDRDATCDAQGRFEIACTPPGSVRLHALDPRTLASIEVGPIECGRDDVEIRLGRSERRARIAGRVLDPRGAPIADASVHARVRVEDQDFDSSDVRTDADGRFELVDVALAARAVVVELDWSVEKAFPIEPANDCSDLALVVGRSGHVRVEIATVGLAADALSVLDADGREMRLVASHGNVRRVGKRGRLVDGKTEPYLVSEDARTLVLYRNGQEVSRMPITIVPGQVNFVRP